MIDLTVKTLDSQNHAFSLADDITIREFKEHIAETVSVPADSQRLIYCGRVLQDEKHLSEYDVNGKVIHLVQRAPPQSTQRGNSGSGQSHGQNRNRGDQPQPQRVRYRQTRTQFHGNPMYLGSISIPAEVVEGHEWPIPQLSNTLSNSRLVIAARMLDQANRVLDRLENPTAAAAAATANESNAPETDESASGTGTATSGVSQQDIRQANTAEQLLRNLSGARPMAGIYEIAAAITASARPPFVLPFRMNAGETSGTESSAPAAETTDETQTQEQPQQQQQQQQESSRPGSANAGTDQSANPRARPANTTDTPRTPRMAQLLGILMETQDRLRPFMTRYRELMELDPEIPGGRTASGEDIGTVEDNQRIADGVTECLHFLSHANHALSDIIVDVGQQPPRNLRCRPMVIQHSAILQAGIPIQVEAHISVARNDGSNGESGEENGEPAARPPTSVTVTPPTAQNPIDLTFVTEQQEPAAPTAGQQTEQQQQQQQAQSQPQADSPFGAIFNLTNNMEVLMEMGPPDGPGISVNGTVGPTGTEQSATNGSNNNNNNNNNNNAPGTSGVAGIFPWGPAPPPEVFRNLMNVVAGYMAQSAAAVTTVATTTSTSTPTSCLQQRAMAVAVGGGAAPNPGQSTQARSNVGTHPTTSTQTRSTARPHVFHPHAHPLGVGVGMGQNMDFDPFLPCNSHHIRRTPSSTPNNSAATSSPQQTSQPSQSTTPNGAAQTQPDGPPETADQNGPSTTTATKITTTTTTTVDQSTSNIRLRDEIANLQRSSVEETASAATLEELLLSRGINIMWSGRTSGNLPHVLQRLFTACARIEISEWYALLNDGKFTRDDTWRRLRPHITTVILFNGTDTQARYGGTAPSGFAEGLSEQIILELQPYLSELLESDERRASVAGGRRVDLPATVEYIVYRFVEEVARHVQRNVNAIDDDEWGMNLAKIVQRFGRELCSTLQSSLRRKQAGLEDLIRYFARRVMSSHHGELREWVLGNVVDWFCEYSRQIEREPGTGMHQIMVYEGNDSEEISGSNEAANVARSRETQPQPEPEPMETEEATGNRTINDPLELDDGQEVPTTFPGHESLLPEWVPIIARDGIRQRRQLQLQGAGVTAFSDAYLDGLPSKRRKLVEQQKPRLLVSPTANHSSIPASMERLVRESVVRAGVEEADGATAAVAADPGVRRAFGQAIRECLHPRRLQTPDFPDSRRFPNATSYFTDKERPPKQ